MKPRVYNDVKRAIAAALCNKGEYFFVAPDTERAKKAFVLATDFISESDGLREETLIRFSQMHMEFNNGSALRFMAADRPEQNKGFRFDGWLVVDEYGEMSAEMWQIVRCSAIDGKEIT